MLEFSQSRKFLRKFLRSCNRASPAFRALSFFLGYKRTEFQFFSRPRAYSRNPRRKCELFWLLRSRSISRPEKFEISTGGSTFLGLEKSHFVLSTIIVAFDQPHISS